MGSAFRIAVLAPLMLASPALAADVEPAPRRCTLEPGVRELTLEVGAFTRRFLVSVGPEAARAASPPVIFLWHGFGSSGREMLRSFDPARDWPEGIAVAAQGLPRRFQGRSLQRLPGWQVRAGELGDRDLRLFDALLGALTEQYCIDRTRVYSAGLSNGAYFSNLLGCQRGPDLAGIAPTAGGGPFPESCATPMAVLVTHGRRDDVVPPSRARQSLETWTTANRCELPAELPELGCTTLPGCSPAIAYCVHAGGHVWPGEMPGWLATFLRGARGPLR